MKDFTIGDYVQIFGQEAVGEILFIKGNDLEIEVGGMKVRIKKNKVHPVPKPDLQNKFMEHGSVGIDTKSKLLHFKFELDIRGKSREEVINELTSWTDDAILLGIEEAKIIHGRGTGALKDTVRAFLKTYPHIMTTSDEEGKSGSNVTIVKFRI